MLGLPFFTPRTIYTSQVVVSRADSTQSGEIFAIDTNPYTGEGDAAYVVGNDWADWIALGDLAPVNGTALMAVGAATSAVA